MVRYFSWLVEQAEQEDMRARLRRDQDWLLVKMLEDSEKILWGNMFVIEENSVL
jgi:hypothetical protein